MENKFIINFTPGTTPLHRLTGATKVRVFLEFIWLIIAVWDIRLLSFLLVCFMVGAASLKPYWRPIRILMLVVVWMNLLNVFLYYLFSPDIGQQWAGSLTYFHHIAGRYNLSYETLWYFITRLVKLFSSFACCLVFILSVTPSEFAAGLASLHLPYRFCIIVMLAFRYIPDLLRDYKEISVSAQARGSETDKRKTSLIKRLKSSFLVIVPLILSSFGRINEIANAMDLRGFGKSKKRTWYAERPNQTADKVLQAIGFLALLLGIYVTLMRVFNPDNPQLWYPFNDLTTYNWAVLP